MIDPEIFILKWAADPDIPLTLEHRTTPQGKTTDVIMLDTIEFQEKINEELASAAQRLRRRAMITFEDCVPYPYTMRVEIMITELGEKRLLKAGMGLLRIIRANVPRLFGQERTKT